MTEYIERGALLEGLKFPTREEIEKRYIEIEADQQPLDVLVDTMLAISMLYLERVKSTSAADVEPVVRCGKCKYADVGADGFIETCNYWNDEFNTFHLTTMHPNGYCSNGIERIIPHMDLKEERK